MKKYLSILMVLLITAIVVAGCTSDKTEATQEAADVSDEDAKPVFTLINMTDKEIHGLYISVSNMENWGSSLLGKNEVFHRGDEMSVKYPNLSDSEMYDIKCEDSNGNAVYFTELALYSVNKLTLTVDESGRAVAAIEERDMGITSEISEGGTEAEYEATQIAEATSPE